MLDGDPGTAPLRDWASALATWRGALVPQFDPAEGGVDAKVLVLLEAPGPMTNTAGARSGSGFISVDNDDATAEAMWRARDAAGLDQGVLTWNIVPWYLGSAEVKPTGAELAAGAEALRDLLGLLPVLEVVVLSGRYAQSGWQRYVAPHVEDELTVVEVWHPSPLSLNQPGRRDAFNASIREVADLLAGN